VCDNSWEHMLCNGCAEFTWMSCIFWLVATSDLDSGMSLHYQFSMLDKSS